MASVTVKNLPADLYARLKKSAAQHRRSINREAIVCLEKVLSSSKVDSDAFLAGVRALRKTNAGLFLTDRDLRRARLGGRP